MLIPDYEKIFKILQGFKWRRGMPIPIKHANGHTQLGDFKSLSFLLGKNSNVEKQAEILLIIHVCSYTSYQDSVQLLVRRN
jgi:hypothetical protein